MPFIKPKSSAKTASAAVLSWDSFPPPPPEAEKWQPDPGSIPRPGDIPDPRFNRDPEADKRSKAFKKEARLYGLPARTNSGVSPSPSTSGNALPQGLGEWPAPPTRATGYPRDLVRNATPPTPPLSSTGSSAPVSTFALDSPSNEPAPITMKRSSAHIAAPVTKGPMETLAMPKPNYRRPQTPVPLTVSVLSGSPDKSVPAWAAPLEKALAEDIRKASAESAKSATTTGVQARPETTRKISVPPHLRSKVDSDGMATETQGPRLNPAAKIYERDNQDNARAHTAEKLVGEEVRLEEEALAWTMATMELGVDNVKQGMQLQAQMLSAYTTKQSTTTATTTGSQISHEQKVKVMLIRGMEAELDLGKVATERELMAMSQTEINKFYEKVRSAHENWWTAEPSIDGSFLGPDSCLPPCKVRR